MSVLHLQRAVVGEDAVQTWCGRTVPQARVTSVVQATCQRCWRAAPTFATVRAPRRSVLVDSRRDCGRHLDPASAKLLPRSSQAGVAWTLASSADTHLAAQPALDAWWRLVRGHLARLHRAYRNGVPGAARPDYVELWNFGVIVYSRRES